MDIHICGSCKIQFTDIAAFVNHKQTSCELTQHPIDFVSFCNSDMSTNLTRENVSVNPENLQLLNDVENRVDYSVSDTNHSVSEFLGHQIKTNHLLKNPRVTNNFHMEHSNLPTLHSVVDNHSLQENIDNAHNTLLYLKNSTLNDINSKNGCMNEFSNANLSLLSNTDSNSTDLLFTAGSSIHQQLKPMETAAGNVDFAHLLNGGLKQNVTAHISNNIPITPFNADNATETKVATHRKIHALVSPKKDKASSRTAPARLFSCNKPGCNFSAVTQRDLARHMRVHTGERPYVCTECKKAFSRSDKLTIHMRAHAGYKPYSCTFCSYTCLENGSLKKHLRTHTNERPFKCQLCPYASRNSNQLTIHLRSHTGDAPYICRVCSAKFKINSDLKRHMRIHLGERPFKCDFCDHRSTLKCNLQNHIKTVHNSASAELCGEHGCTFTASSKKLMWEHTKAHHANDLLVCDVCQYLCTTKTTLKSHMRTHASTKSYTCSLCSYATRHKGNLKTHTNTVHRNKFTSKYRRTKVKVVKGRQSDKSNAASKTGESPWTHVRLCNSLFKCTFTACNETFVREDSLKSHLRHHIDMMAMENTALAVLQLHNSAKQQRPVRRPGGARADVDDVGAGDVQKAGLGGGAGNDTERCTESIADTQREGKASHADREMDLSVHQGKDIEGKNWVGEVIKQSEADGVSTSVQHIQIYQIPPDIESTNTGACQADSPPAGCFIQNLFIAADGHIKPCAVEESDLQNRSLLHSGTVQFVSSNTPADIPSVHIMNSEAQDEINVQNVQIIDPKAIQNIRIVDHTSVGHEEVVPTLYLSSAQSLVRPKLDGGLQTVYVCRQGGTDSSVTAVEEGVVYTRDEQGGDGRTVAMEEGVIDGENSLVPVGYRFCEGALEGRQDVTMREGGDGENYVAPASYQLCEVPQFVYSLVGSNNASVITQQADGTLALVNPMYHGEPLIIQQRLNPSAELSYILPTAAMSDINQDDQSHVAVNRDDQSQVAYRMSTLDTNQHSPLYQPQQMYSIAANLTHPQILNNQPFVYTLSLDRANQTIETNIGTELPRFVGEELCDGGGSDELRETTRVLVGREENLGFSVNDEMRKKSEEET